MTGISISDIISIIGLLAGGGGVGYFFTWRYIRRKEKAEAETAETSAAKEMQDVYQQLITDMKNDRDEQRQYINELKEDRKHLRDERDELRNRQDTMEEQIIQLKRDVARNSRMVEGLRPFMCGLLGCKRRKPVTISADGTIDEEGGER